MFENLEGLLTWLWTGGGAGALAYWLMEQLVGLQAWPKFWRRMTSFALTIMVAIAAYWVAVTMYYEEGCADWRCWVEQIANVALLAVLSSQTLHGKLKLGQGDAMPGLKPPF